jgi:polysaccharide biosynthesis protein PslG
VIAAALVVTLALNAVPSGAQVCTQAGASALSAASVGARAEPRQKPRILAATMFDRDANGFLDAVDVRFNAALVPAAVRKRIRVGRYQVSAVSAWGGRRSRFARRFLVVLTERHAPDSGARPKVSWRINQRLKQQCRATDGARPQVVKVDIVAGAAVLTFSEPVGCRACAEERTPFALRWREKEQALAADGSVGPERRLRLPLPAVYGGELLHLPGGSRGTVVDGAGLRLAAAGWILPRGPKPAIGVHYNCWPDSENRRAATYDLLAGAGVKWVRINYNWNDLESAAPGVYLQRHLATLDDCVARAAAREINVLVSFLATPPWARSGASWNSPPTYVADYARTIGYLADRYKARVQAWEVWNENNTNLFWSGSVSDYVQLLCAAYPAIKSADPDATVVFAGTALNDAAWIDQAYAAGAKPCFDVMSTHPYPRRLPGGPQTPEASLADTRHVRAVMLRYGDTRPLWFTEGGWSTVDFSPEEQADYLYRWYDGIRSFPYVTHAFWFQAVNRAVGASSWERALELISETTLQPKPALAALKVFAES